MSLLLLHPTDVPPETTATDGSNTWLVVGIVVVAVMAAIALAGLRDGAARPVLLRQLTLPSLRVGAAVALRRLEATFDVAPLLSQLDEALTTGKDVDRVDVAEAILILTGPAAWAEYD